MIRHIVNETTSTASKWLARLELMSMLSLPILVSLAFCFFTMKSWVDNVYGLDHGSSPNSSLPSKRKSHRTVVAFEAIIQHPGLVQIIRKRSTNDKIRDERGGSPKVPAIHALLQIFHPTVRSIWPEYYLRESRMAEERFFSHQIELSRHLRTTTPKPSSNRKEEEEEEEDGQVSNLFESPTQACTRLSSDHRLSIHLERKDDEGILDPHQEEDDREEINQINIARQTFLDDLRTGRVSLRNEIRGELDDEVGGEREAENLYETLIRIQPWDRLTCSVLGWEVVFI